VTSSTHHWPSRFWKAAAKRAIPPDARYVVHAELGMLRRGPTHFVRHNLHFGRSYLRDRRHRSRYRILSADDLRERRRSQRVYVFGSGYSLNELTAEEWRQIGKHDVFGFNDFFRQRWVRVDYHVLRAGMEGELMWRAYAEDIRAHLLSNPLFADTAYLMPEGLFADFANCLVGYGYLPDDSAIYRYRSGKSSGPPARTLEEGLRHAMGTLALAVNIAFCLGWREIVLVGVDLYDSRYFWLPPDETQAMDPATGALVGGERNPTRGNRAEDPHFTAQAGIVGLIGSWRPILEEAGVTLSVYNPRSLLAEVLPVFES
jgi:hypothetical protein